MYGTLGRALDARGIEIAPEDYVAEVEGRIEGVGRTIRIASINVHYEFPVPADKREAADRALRGASAGLSRAREREGRHRNYVVRGHSGGVAAMFARALL